MALNFFISYSHKDEAFKDELLEFLDPLQRAGEITIWNDRAIVVGEKWNDEINNALATCDVVLLLVSPSFLASNYINEVEIAQTMKRHYENSLKLVPVLIRPCDLHSHIVPNYPDKIADFQGLPKDMKAVTAWNNRDDAWMNVVNGLKKLVY